MVVWKPKESFTAFLLPSSVASHWLFTPFIVLAGWTLLLPLLLLLYRTLVSFSLSHFLSLSFGNFSTFYLCGQKKRTRGWQRAEDRDKTNLQEDFSRPPTTLSCPPRSRIFSPYSHWHRSTLIAADCAHEHDLAVPNNLLLKDRTVAQQDGRKALPEGSQASVTF